MKRMKLKKYAAGSNVKQFILTKLDVESSNIIDPTELYIACYTGKEEPDLITYSEGWLYPESVFDRRYSVQNPDIVEGGVDLKFKPPEGGRIYDFQQFGDVAFDLTTETRLGTKFATKTTTTIPQLFSDYCCSKHTVISYAPGLQNFGKIQNKYTNLTFDFVEETVKRVHDYFTFNNSNYDSLPFAYLMEQPLNTPLNIGLPKKVYGRGFPIEELYSPNPGTEWDDNTLYATDDDFDASVDKIYLNPFKLKNMYNYNWNMNTYDNYSDDIHLLSGIRDYHRVGASQSTLWLSYSYLTDGVYTVEPYQFVERLKGFYKYKSIANHKSNIYSIKIINSGLNNAMPDGTEKEALRELVYNSIKSAVKKIAPASTQLWKIEYVGD